MRTTIPKQTALSVALSGPNEQKTAQTAIPLKEIRTFCDAEMTRARGPGAIAGIVITPLGHLVHSKTEFVPLATSQEAEMLAVLLSLRAARELLRHPELCTVKVHTDCQAAFTYIVKKRGEKPHLLRVLQQITEAAKPFRNVGYFKVQRDNKGIRKAENLARAELRRRGFAVTHRARKALSSRAAKPEDPFHGIRPNVPKKRSRKEHFRSLARKKKGGKGRHHKWEAQASPPRST